MAPYRYYFTPRYIKNNFLLPKIPKTSTNTECSVGVTFAVNKTATRQNIGFSRALQPVSRHATATIITGPIFMRKRLYSFIDDFLLDFAATLLGTIQVLRNADEGGGVNFSGKKRYEGVWFNVIIVTRGWVGV